jgi:AcrR family transcriptional regulator
MTSHASPKPDAASFGALSLSRLRTLGDRIEAHLAIVEGAAGTPAGAGSPIPSVATMFEQLSEMAATALGHEPGVVMELHGGWVALPSDGPFKVEAVLAGTADSLSIWSVKLSTPQGIAACATLKRAKVVPGRQVANSAEILQIEQTSAKARAQDHAERQRERIVEAAAEIMALKGFAQATVREIADAAGLHVPTLYTYVSSKDELLELVYVTSMDRIIVDIEAATADCATAGEKLGVAMRETLARIEANRRRIGVMNRELRSLTGEARTRVLRRYRVVLDQIAMIIADGVRAGEFRQVEPFIVANMLDALCDMRALRPFSLGEYDPDAFTRELTAFVERALRADAC